MKVLTAEQMMSVDRATIEHGTPGIELMRNAGAEVFNFIEKTLNIRSGIVVLAGKGNNGGDGFRVAELFAQSGCEPVTCLIGDRGDVRGDAAFCMQEYEVTGQRITEITTPDSLAELSETIQSANLIIDALFGTGLKGEISGLPASVFGMVNRSHAMVVAVDIPSGVNASTGEISSSVIQADYTVTFGCAKVGHVMMPGRGKCGEVHVTDIGFSEEVIQSTKPFAHSLTLSEARSLLPKRVYNAHKGSAGRAFILAGSVGMTGAAVLSSSAAMRSGAGMVTVGCPESLNDILEVKLTEVMTLPLPEMRKKRCLALRGLGRLRDEVRSADVVAIGPGLGTYTETAELVRRFLAGYEGMVVLDADGISIFKSDTETLKNSPSGIVLTPHYGELSRLMDIPVEDISGDPVTAAVHAAESTKKIVLLKGPNTVIADPEGTVWLNSAGNEGMATAGMGDVLTGVIAGFIAQGLDLVDAAALGAYVHGLAGDYTSDETGTLGMLSGDVLELLPQVLKDISETDTNNAMLM